MVKKLKRAMICVPIVACYEEEVIKQVDNIIEKNKYKKIDIVEFRADFYYKLNEFDKLENILIQIKDLLNKENIKLLFTIRSEREGGEKLSFVKPSINEINYFVVENQLADFVDIEYFSDKNTAEKVMKKAVEKDIKILMSSHDFEKTPSLDEMIERYKGMYARGANIIKLAVMPKDKADVDKLCEAVSAIYNTYDNVSIVGISMGELGKETRINGYKYGSCLTFAALEKVSAPGQVSVDDIE